MYKFGISYNVFDGEELLEDSILCIRDLVDYISVIYQTKSNYGNPCSDKLIKILIDLKSRGLVDEIKEYNPQINVSPHVNEINKRNAGLLMSMDNECSHHMTMDCDEFYVTEKFRNIINWHKNNPNHVSFCQLINYYKSPEYQLEDYDNTHVTLFFPINYNSAFILEYPTPVLIDPTRKPNCNIHHVFSSNEIVMHHMHMVRKNIESKLINSSALVNYRNKLKQIIDYYNNWIDDGNELMGLKINGLFKIKKVEAQVKLKKYNELY